MERLPTGDSDPSEHDSSADKPDTTDDLREQNAEYSAVDDEEDGEDVPEPVKVTVNVKGPNPEATVEEEPKTENKDSKADKAPAALQAKAGAEGGGAEEETENRSLQAAEAAERDRAAKEQTPPEVGERDANLDTVESKPVRAFSPREAKAAGNVALEGTRGEEDDELAKKAAAETEEEAEQAARDDEEKKAAAETDGDEESKAKTDVAEENNADTEEDPEAVSKNQAEVEESRAENLVDAEASEPGVNGSTDEQQADSADTAEAPEDADTTFASEANTEDGSEDTEAPDAETAGDDGNVIEPTRVMNRETFEEEFRPVEVNADGERVDLSDSTELAVPPPPETSGSESEQEGDQASEHGDVDPEHLTVTADQRAFLEYQARLFGYEKEEIKSYTDAELASQVSQTIAARIGMGVRIDEREGVVHRAQVYLDIRDVQAVLLRQGWDLSTKENRENLAKAVLRETIRASGGRVYNGPLHARHGASHRGRSHEPTWQAQANYRVHAQNLHHPDPVVRRQARLTMARRGELTPHQYQMYRRAGIVPWRDIRKWGQPASAARPPYWRRVGERIGVLRPVRHGEYRYNRLWHWIRNPGSIQPMVDFDAEHNPDSPED